MSEWTEHELKLLDYCAFYDGSFSFPGSNLINLVNKLWDKIEFQKEQIKVLNDRLAEFQDRAAE